MSKITMSARIQLEGDEGVMKSFIIQQQYEYLEKEYRIVTARNADNEDKGQTCYHYKVEVDNNVFWVPGIYCVEYDGEIGIYNKKGQYGNVVVTDDLLTRKGELERRKFSNEDMAPDFAKQSKLMLNRRITNAYKPDIDKRLVELRLSSKVNKNYPGNGNQNE